MLDATLVHQVRSSAAETAVVTSKLSGEARVVEPGEYKEAAACLAEAFRHDKVVRYAVDTPDRMHWTEEKRYEMHKQAMEYVTYAHCLNGLVLTIGDNFDCVALWLPPGKNIDDWVTIVRSGMWRMQFSLSTEGKERFFNEFLPLLSRSKTEILADRDHHSWYLNYIGTKASARGKGYARKLIEHVTKLVSRTPWSSCITLTWHQADEEGLPCYLESSHDINLIIYGKMGFELRKQIYLQRATENYRLDVMVREPKVVSNKKMEKTEKAM